MKSIKYLMIAVLGIVIVACEPDPDINSPESESKDQGISLGEGENSEECFDVLEGFAEGFINFYVLGGNYSDCKELISSVPNFDSVLQFDGISLFQESQKWLSLENFDMVDSLIFVRGGIRLDFVFERENIENSSIIYLSEDNDGRFGYALNYLNISECHSSFIKLQDGEVQLVNDSDC